ncbi:hypothetical protein [Rhodococcus opacus]|uniref:hypothetical protein n=1 Tax=Rhodococcus opacus TaxID=37919 RepID=UPI003CD03871
MPGTREPGTLALMKGRRTTALPPAPRVQATASGLTLDGRPWWPAGLNAYQPSTD